MLDAVPGSFQQETVTSNEYPPPGPIRRSQQGASGALAKGPSGVGPMSTSSPPPNWKPHIPSIQFRCRLGPGTGTSIRVGRDFFPCHVVAAHHWSSGRMCGTQRYFLQHARAKIPLSMGLGFWRMEAGTMGEVMLRGTRAAYHCCFADFSPSTTPLVPRTFVLLITPTTVYSVA